MEVKSVNATRGFGFLENFLAARRAAQIDRQIPHILRNGSILDIGSGSYPFFLRSIDFKEKTGLDKSIDASTVEGIKQIPFELKTGEKLQFEDGYFNVVSLLAVIEHLNSGLSEWTLKEAYRVLSPGGILLITVPPKRVDGLLRLMAKLKLVSAEEINEHQQMFDPEELKRQLKLAGFTDEHINIRYWMFGLNLFAEAIKNNSFKVRAG